VSTQQAHQISPIKLGLEMNMEELLRSIYRKRIVVWGLEQSERERKEKGCNNKPMGSGRETYNS
jgi:hypothetical protein